MTQPRAMRATRNARAAKRPGRTARSSGFGQEARYRRLEHLYGLAELVNQAESMAEIQERALDALFETLKPDRAAILLLDEKGTMRFSAWRGLSDAYRRAVEGRSPWPRDTAEPAPLLVEDISGDEARASVRDLVLAEGIRALAYIPLVHRGRLLGTFMLYHDKPHRFTPEEVDLARIIATHVGFALAKKGVQDRLSLYRQIFENSTDGIAIIDVDGRYIEQNPAHLRLTGYSAQELAGNTPAVHLGEEAFAAIARELAEKGIYSGELISHPKNGRSAQVALSAFALRDEAGKVLSYVGIKRDITASKQAQDEQRFLAGAGALLGESLDYEKAVSDLARLAVPVLGDWCVVAVVEPDGRIRRIALVHSDPEKTAAAREQEAARMISPDTPFGLALAIRTGQPQVVEDVPSLLDKLPRPPGRERLSRILGVQSSLTVPLQARGRILGAVSLFAVESGRRYTAADLPLVQEFARRASLAVDNARLYSEVQTATAAKDEFLGLVSHELRTPLTGIYGAVRVLRSRGEQLSPGDRGELLEVLEQESDRMRRLVEDLLVLSRLDLGQQVVLEPVMAQRVVEKVLATMGPTNGNRKVQMQIAPGLPPVAAEPTFMEQVLRNLINNADKYSPPGSPIDVRVAQTPDADLEISVLDRGGGIAPEDVEKIFEPFYRAPGTARTKGGMGIGLTVCKRLTEAQSGYIWARPRPGGGVEIGFTLHPYQEGDE